MWARISEMILGTWLILSHFFFDSPFVLDLTLGALTILISGLCYIDAISKLHLCHPFITAILLSVSYCSSERELPFFLQNYILVGLGLLMFCIIPSRAFEPPKPWRELNKNGSKK